MSTKSDNITPPASSKGSAAWRSPSNIALVKYWGKKPGQIPTNASISLTLSQAYTETRVSYTPRDAQGEWISFWFEKKKEPLFRHRIVTFFESLKSHMPWLESFDFEIHSHNSFPHSSGIASSASSMSALALCLCDIEKKMFPQDYTEEFFGQRASHIARLGSGSAARSIIPFVGAWGATKHLVQSNDIHATPVKGIDPVFHTFHDDILIISDEKKEVSSSAGHALMDTNIFAQTRYEQADQHFGILLLAMQSGDIDLAGSIIEDEAMTLHALMMCSKPSFILMKPNTLTVIEKLRAFRRDTGLPVFFSLDAGPNVHILYPDSIKDQIWAWINSEVLSLTHEERVIRDTIGPGPIKLDMYA